MWRGSHRGRRALSSRVKQPIELHITIHGLNQSIYLSIYLFISSVTSLKGFIRWDPFVLRAQWTWVHWVCTGTIKHCFLVSVSRVSVGVPIILLGVAGIAEMVLSTSIVAGVCSPACLEKWSQQVPVDSLIWKGTYPPRELGWVLSHTIEPSEAQEPVMGVPSIDW
jgi:hypothetical protein